MHADYFKFRLRLWKLKNDGSFQILLVFGVADSESDGRSKKWRLMFSKCYRIVLEISIGSTYVFCLRAAAFEFQVLCDCLLSVVFPRFQGLVS